MEKIRILIADDQTLMRDGLKTIFDLEDDLEVVAAAENGMQAWVSAKLFKPDVALLDIRMPGMNGIECVKRIKKDSPGTVILMLTTFDEAEYIVESLSNGAAGFLLKDMQGEQLIDAVRSAAAGQTVLPGAIASKLVSHLAGSMEEAAGKIRLDRLKDNGETFTEREMEIIQLMVQGLNNRKIAEKLQIGEGTARNYISVIYSKIGVNDRAEAIHYLSRLLAEERE